MRNSRRIQSSRSTKPLIALFVLVLALAACGSSDQIDAGTAQDPDSEQDGTSTPEDTGDSEDAGGSADYVATTSHPELISAQPAMIAELVAIDDQTIGVRYQNGSEPCSLANVTVTEGDSEITVALETGLDPNAAAMSCIAQVMDYEIQVSLDAPIGDRTLVAAEV